MYKVETFPLGLYQANCYLLWKDKHAIMIDPGSMSEKLLRYIKEQDAIVDAILLTHGHFDHIGGVDYFANAFHCPVYIDEEDEILLQDTYLNGSLPIQKCIVNTPVTYYRIGKNEVGCFTFEAIFAPGHTLGCAMLRFDQLLFSGDVLFQNSIGRTDLAMGDDRKMKESLKMIKKLDPTLIVYPGHGPTTTLKEELKTNPFLY